MFSEENVFGNISFEAEKDSLGDDWEEYYFQHVPFSEAALAPKCYIIVGRKGSGKSSLAEFFKYQKRFLNARCAHISDLSEYNYLFSRIMEHCRGSRERAIQDFTRAWTYIIWEGIFKVTRLYSKKIPTQDLVSQTFTSELVAELLRGLSAKLLTDDLNLVDIVDERRREAKYERGKVHALSVMRRRPLIVAIDSNEHYPIQDEHSLCSLAGLIEAAAKINSKHARRDGLHVKVFVPDEILSHLSTDVISNYAKYVRNLVYMQWTPRRLMRLVCWRLHKYLYGLGMIDFAEDDLNWDSPTEVKSRLWHPYFGKTILNRNSKEEGTLAYVMRHTQLRPRQLMMLCNNIAWLAIGSGEFPHFSAKTIRQAVMDTEMHLAMEVINSYSRVYPNIGGILSALNKLPMEFEGKELDRVAKRTSALWEGSYSLPAFRSLVSALGIVGRKRSESEGYVEADFEYFTPGSRLNLSETDECVIHPMYYRTYGILTDSDKCVNPFPSDSEIVRDLGLSKV